MNKTTATETKQRDRFDLRRHALGMISVLFLGAWIALLATGADGGGDKVLASASMRIGLVLGALWLALPQLSQLSERFPPWLLGILAIGGLLIAVRPRIAVYIIPIGLGIAVLQFLGWLFKPPPTVKKR